MKHKNQNKMPNKETGDDVMTWLISHIFTASVLAFSMDLLKAFCLGIVGALGGLLAKWFYNNYLQTKNRNDEK